jgi:hypothetical protein
LGALVADFPNLFGKSILSYSNRGQQCQERRYLLVEMSN